jgi:hypothetical protein
LIFPEGTELLTGLAALENTDWSRLYHAYGPAMDTPGQLLSLLEPDPESRKSAMSHLWSAIIHQGTPWTATGPAALVVAGLLSDERLDRGEPIRASLLSFLVSVAEVPEQAGWTIEELERMAAFDVEPFFNSEDDNVDAANSFYARSILSCIEVAPVLMEVMLSELGNSSPRVRAWAAMGAVALARTDSLRGFSKDLESQLLEMARSAQDTDERSSLVLALGDLGVSPSAFLEDPSPAVRMCAALAPGLATDAAAINELIKALEYSAGNIDHWFVEKPPQFPMRPRFPVVQRLVEQVKDFDRVVDAAIAVVDVTTKRCADFDWGPLLAAAFSDGSGIIKTESQRRFLGQMVKNTDLWDPLFGNARRWFQKTGLPYDRTACAKLVDGARSQSDG